MRNNGHVPVGLNGAAPSSVRSWLIDGDADRNRLLDMDRRLRPVRHRTFVVLAAALVLASPWVGWWTLGPLVVAAALFRVAETRIERAAHPEYWMLAAWTGAELRQLADHTSAR